MSGIFLTGATGFVGGHVLRRLTDVGLGPVLCLVRDRSSLPELPDAVRAVPGDLDDPGTWSAALEGCDTVVHLAALTGKAADADHFRVNAGGTSALLDAARAAGVRRFLFVSTIAVNYPEKRAYPYARAKEEAERRVRDADLDWAIVRPTVVLGPGSPLWAKFRSLACAPVVPVFGSGRNRIQPVHVGDVAASLVDLLGEERLGGRTLEVGGSDVLSMEEFLLRIRSRATGKSGPVVRLPVRAIIGVLSVLERVLLPVLPVGAGQFYVFAYDATASEDGVGRRGVDAMIAEHLEQGGGEEEPPPSDDRLDRECSALCRHLIGREPGEYVRAKYRAAHRPGAVMPARGGPDPLTDLALEGPVFARLADAWAAVLARGGTFRCKLVLLIALLESSGETSATVDTPDRGTRPGLVLAIAFRAAGFLLTFLASLVVVPAARILGTRAGPGNA